MIYWLMGVCTALIAGLDQWTKYLVTQNMALGETVPALDGIFALHYVRNSGMAWSMFEGARWIFVALTVAVLILVVVAIQKNWLVGKLQLISVAVIMGGAIGNLIDRIATGEVVDMIQLTFMNFPTFNVADCFITCGTIVFAFDLIFGDLIRKKKQAKSPSEKPHDLDT